MPSRRQEKIARVVREAVSDAIRNRLNDPRIEGLISVTNVDVSADLRNAEVYLSVMGTSEAGRSKTFKAIEHAGRHIQKHVGQQITSRFCPHLHFHEDDKLKKTLETMKLIEEASRELRAGRLSSSDTAGDNEQ
ncbi:MAG: 30S ribosome-binding factor RbfA [Planctomycetota bacterium]